MTSSSSPSLLSSTQDRDAVATTFSCKPAVFAYPHPAEVHRVVPKAKIYAQVRPSKRLRERFVSQVGEIIWRYKLSPESIRLPARDEVTEIQVFEIALKSPALHPDVLAAIDRAIPFPILFEITHADQITFAASYKHPPATPSAPWVIEASFQTDPLPRSASRPPLPMALDLKALLHQILRSHMPLQPRPGESMLDHVTRYRTMHAMQRDARSLHARLLREPQFNRRVEINASLRSLARQIQALGNP